MLFCEEFKKYIINKGFVLYDKKHGKKYADCLTDAFYDYPLMHDWFDNNIFDSAINAMHEITFMDEIDGCVIFADSEDVNGICVVGKPFLNSVVNSSLYDSNIMKIKGKCKYINIKRIIDFQRYCVEVRNKYTNGGDCIHCVYLGVRKSHQGQGIGKKLLFAVHEYAKKINKPVYLDTHKYMNVDIYKHLGYELKSSVPYENSKTMHNALVFYP